MNPPLPSLDQVGAELNRLPALLAHQDHFSGPFKPFVSSNPTELCTAQT